MLLWNMGRLSRDSSARHEPMGQLPHETLQFVHHRPAHSHVGRHGSASWPSSWKAIEGGVRMEPLLGRTAALGGLLPHLGYHVGHQLPAKVQPFPGGPETDELAPQVQSVVGSLHTLPGQMIEVVAPVAIPIALGPSGPVEGLELLLEVGRLPLIEVWPLALEQHRGVVLPLPLLQKKRINRLDDLIYRVWEFLTMRVCLAFMSRMTSSE